MNPQNILIIYNPQAGAKYPKNYQTDFLRQIKKHLPKIKHEWLTTTIDLTGQLKQVRLNNFDRIIIIGGDGTIKETADFLLTNKIDLPLAIIPQGSANILASSLNIPLSEKQAIKTACMGIENRIDVGLLNGQHYFLICLSIGFWSKVVNETKRGLKIKLGFLAYLLTFLKQKKFLQTKFKLNIDGQQHAIKGNTLVIANAMSLFKLKPKKPVDFFDGQLDIFITKNKTFFGFLIIGLLGLFNKRYLPNLFRSSGKIIKVDYELNNKKTVQIDGEIINTNKIEVKVIPKKLKIISK